MFDIDLQFQNIHISSIEKCDLIDVYKWIRENDVYDNRESKLEFRDFCSRFLEYYLGEGEVFTKICVNGKLIGLLKGRIEFKSSNEIWIWYFGIDKEFRNKDMDSNILHEFMKYFSEYSIERFYVVISSNEKEDLSFWNKNGFVLVRICNNLINSKETCKTFILINEQVKID